jgi:Phosphoribosylanthranilate isomerase
MSYQVKVCGLTHPEDFHYCAEAGAWTGFIFHPASPRYISPEQAAAIETGSAIRVGVFVDQGPAEVQDIMAKARLNLAQLHGGQAPDFCRSIGPERVIKVFWPQRYASPADLAADLEKYADSAAYFLLDAGAGGGGHGQPLDLDFLKNLRSPRPWLLAGGLKAENIKNINPADWPGLYGFDFNSGLEQAPGIKDHNLIRAALQAVSDLDQNQHGELS